MSFRKQDFGEIGYGGVVTLASWWDGNRISKGSLADKAVVKKAGFWTYWGIGLFSTLSSVMGWFRRQDLWMEHISHGFLYDVPRQVFNLVQSQRAAPHYVADDAAAALQEARSIINAAKQQQPAGRETHGRAGDTIYGTQKPELIR